MQQTEQELEQEPRRRRRIWIIPVLGSLVTFVLIAAITGIIGNRSDNLFLTILGAIKSSATPSLWPWIIMVLILLAAIAGMLNSWHQRRILDNALITANNINDLDDSLLRLLASWVPSRNHEAEMKLLFTELLRDACKEFVGHVHRAFILTPDPNNINELTVWASIGIPPETIEHLRFYIGNNRSGNPMRGVAGEVFLARRLRVVHIIPEKDGWRTDCSSHFIKFQSRAGLPAYRSFVCVPIIGADPDIHQAIPTCHGVVVFDSLDHGIFDRPESQIVLRTFARRIASALLISRLLSQLGS
jgi:hypothetical protein